MHVRADGSERRSRPQLSTSFSRKARALLSCRRPWIPLISRLAGELASVPWWVLALPKIRWKGSGTCQGQNFTHWVSRHPNAKQTCQSILAPKVCKLITCRDPAFSSSKSSIRPRSAGVFWFRARFDSRPGLNYSTCVTHSWSSAVPGQDQNQCRSSVVQHGMEPSQCPDSEQQINSQQLIYFANRHITLRAEISINHHAKKKRCQLSSWFSTTDQQLIQYNCKQL